MTEDGPIHLGIVWGSPPRVDFECGAAGDDGFLIMDTGRVTCPQCLRLIQITAERQREREAAEKRALAQEAAQRRRSLLQAPKIWVARACGARLSDVARHFRISVGRVAYLDAKITRQVERQWRRFEARAHRGPIRSGSGDS